VASAQIVKAKGFETESLCLESKFLGQAAWLPQLREREGRGRIGKHQRIGRQAD
jgi:hypothetical protein